MIQLRKKFFITVRVYRFHALKWDQMLHDLTIFHQQLLHIPSPKFGKLSIGNLRFQNEEFSKVIRKPSSRVSCKLPHKFTTERAIRLITSRGSSSWTTCIIKYNCWYKIQRDIVDLYTKSCNFVSTQVILGRKRESSNLEDDKMATSSITLHASLGKEPRKDQTRFFKVSR